MSLEKVIDDKITDLLMKIDKQKLPKHVAIIMDGNGRWATRKGLPRSFGHKPVSYTHLTLPTIAKV